MNLNNNNIFIIIIYKYLNNKKHLLIYCNLNYLNNYKRTIFFVFDISLLIIHYIFNLTIILFINIK